MSGPNNSISDNWLGIALNYNSVLNSNKLSIMHNHYGIYLNYGAHANLFYDTVSDSKGYGLSVTLASHTEIWSSHFIDSSINAQQNSVINGNSGTTLVDSPATCSLGGMVIGINGQNCTSW